MKKISYSSSGEVKNRFPAGKWDAGAKFNVDLNWDCDNYIISADEVLKELKQYIKKWKGLNKFKIKKPNITIEFVR